MRKLLWQLVLPLTIISFATFGKWWYAFVYDGPHEVFSGFPLPYVCSGWHTSLSLQIFVLELIIDIITYFSFWLLLTFLVNKFLVKIKVHKVLKYILFPIAVFFLTGMTFLALNPDNIYTFKRPFDIEIKETGFQFFGINAPEIDYDKYKNESTTRH